MAEAMSGLMGKANPFLAAGSMALAAAPLFFGENNIFSGKARQANRELEKNFRASQAMGLPTEYNQALQSRLQQANVGIPGAAMGLYQQQAGRAQASQLGALGSRRSALAGIGGIAQAGNDAALQMAGMQANALQQNRAAADQALMTMGGLKQQEELRKQQEAADYWGGRRAEANVAVSGALSALGSAAGSALSTGAFNKMPKLPTDASGVTNAMKSLGISMEDVMGTNASTNSSLNELFTVPKPKAISFLTNKQSPSGLSSFKLPNIASLLKR